MYKTVVEGVDNSLLISQCDTVYVAVRRQLRSVKTSCRQLDLALSSFLTSE